MTDISKLSPGDPHYMAYVGPPAQYDVMGATQFSLLCALGLRAPHRLLDFGCGSLRAGRLFLSYLDAGRYYGIEPNRWLIDDAIENQVGADLIRLKQPAFDYNDRFEADVFATRFDFILAQSIFSHTGIDLLSRGLHNFSAALEADGLIAASFFMGRPDAATHGWVYPSCVPLDRRVITRVARETGLTALPIPWYNPRLTWFLFAKNPARLPSPGQRRNLRGAIVFGPEFRSSWSLEAKLKKALMGILWRTRPELARRLTRV